MSTFEERLRGMAAALCREVELDPDMVLRVSLTARDAAAAWLRPLLERAERAEGRIKGAENEMARVIAKTRQIEQERDDWQGAVQLAKDTFDVMHASLRKTLGAAPDESTEEAAGRLVRRSEQSESAVKYWRDRAETLGNERDAARAEADRTAVELGRQHAAALKLKITVGVLSGLLHEAAETGGGAS